MENVLDAIRSSTSKVTIVGTLPFADPDSWQAVCEALFTRMDSVDLQCQVIGESDNALFQHSLRTDTPYLSDTLAERIAFTQLKLQRGIVRKEVEKADRSGSFRLSTLPLPLYVVQADNSLWYLPVTGANDKLALYRKLDSGDPWYGMVSSMMSQLLDEERDGRYLVAPEKELLELFDQDSIPRGIYPRDCFYNSDHYQFVVWAFVFSRNGKLLIHQRSKNAKDNQGMWDKSVGGHVDFKKERSSADAASRELIEELFTKEKDQQTGHEYSLLSEDVSKTLFLGNWRPSAGADSLNQISALERGTAQGEEPWVFFQIPGGTIKHNTPRKMPDDKGGGVRKLRVLADVFIFIANTALDESSFGELENSLYKLVSPSQLKSWSELGHDDKNKEFKVTPDLEYILSGKLRDTLAEVSQLIQYASIRRSER